MKKPPKSPKAKKAASAAIKAKKEEKKKDITTTIKLSLKKLKSENDRSKGILDKIAKQLEKKGDSSQDINIDSHFVLKRNCSRLSIYLHQKMFHGMAMRVAEVSKLIEKNMSKRAFDEIKSAMDEVSRKHGFDFDKN